MKSLYLLLIVTFCFISCDNKDHDNLGSSEKEILSKEKTISILEELVLIETHLQAKYYSFANYHESLILSRDSVLKSKNTNIRQFNNSFNYYAKTDKDLIDLYENVLNNYNEKSAKATVIQK